MRVKEKYNKNKTINISVLNDTQLVDDCVYIYIEDILTNFKEKLRLEAIEDFIKNYC